ncbi:hypothetical protein [Planctomycetes bacterium K23_9]
MAVGLLLAGLLSGCGSAEGPQVQRVAVHGKVTLDGKPLQAAAIVFHQEQTSDDGSAMVTHGMVQDGAYRIDVQNGPAVGLARVEFRPKPLSREEVEAAMDESMKGSRRRVRPSTVVDIPQKYSAKATQLRVQLADGTENQQDFQLDSKR